MKQGKHIIEQLILQDQSSHQSLASLPSSDFHPQFEPVYDFDVFVDIGDGRTDTIFMNETSDPYQQAQTFCTKHNLDHAIAHLLADSLAQQSQKERELAKHASKMAVVSQPEQLVESKRVQSGSQRPRGQRKRWWKPEEELAAISINEVSEQIVRKAGKQSIIDSNKRRMSEKMNQLIYESCENEAKELEGCSFHPTINPISIKVDQTLHQSRKEGSSRFEQLYEHHRTIKTKQEEQRRNSLNEIPFKPSLNDVSRTIMKKKSALPSAQKPVLSRPKQQIKKSRSCSRVAHARQGQGVQLGCHLYDEAKRRQERLQREIERQGQVEQWQITEQSNLMIGRMREDRIRQVFASLAVNNLLNHRFIRQSSLSDVQKIFLPIFDEMKEIDSELTEEEFLQAGLRLIKYLSPSERDLLVKKKKESRKEDKENAMTNQKAKSKCSKRGYGEPNIYVRGVLFKREVRDQIEKSRENKVRKELQDCTFKPHINAVSHNIAY